jgi:hypothetical protein
MSDFEKELAVLKGRVDGLEAKVGELESSQSKSFQGSVLLVDTYDINTGQIVRSAKVIQATQRRNRWTRPRANNAALFVSHSSAVLFDEENETGNWPLIKVRHFGDTSLTGKDLAIGGGDFDGKNYYNSGFMPSSEGSIMVINKQMV